MADKSLHIVIYSDITSSKGGRETWLKYFVEGVVNEYNSIQVYHIGSAVSSNTSNSVNFVAIESRSVFDYSVKLLKIAKLSIKNCDTVIFCGINLESMAFIFLKLANVKFKSVMWVRGTGITELNAYWTKNSPKNYLKRLIARFIEGIAFRMTKFMIYNGNDTKKIFESRYYVKKHSIVIPNAIDIVPRRVIFNSMGNFRASTIAYVGRLVSTKGFDSFIDLADSLASSGYTFHAFGDNIAQKYKENDSIIFHGKYSMTEISKVFEQFDIVVFLNQNLNSAAGGISHGILEAMASGKVIVAWSNPTHAQLLDRDNSFLVEEGNLPALVATVLGIKNKSIDEINQKITLAYERATEYTVEKHIEKYISFIEGSNGR